MNDPIIFLAFLILAAVMLISSLAVVLLRNIVHCALFLALSFLSVAGLYVLLNAEFLAAVQILIYAGAVMILMMFAIMLTQRANTEASNPPNSQRLWAGLVAVVLFGIVAAVFSRTSWITGGTVPTLPNTEVLGRALFDYYVLPFEIASVLLLVAMVGAIVIARED